MHCKNSSRRWIIPVTLAMTLLAGVPASAETIKARVSGLVCAYCVQGIEKAFKKLDAVEHIAVDLDNGLVTIHTKAKGDVTDDTVKTLVTDAGYSLTAIERE